MTEQKRGITGTGLKMIAIVAMFIDHFAAILLEGYLEGVLPANDEELEQFFQQNPKVSLIYMIMFGMRLIGRFGFPIFAFLIVEGFLHTSNLKKYILNLGVFALISEIPFNLGFDGKLIDRLDQNVFWTLLFGLLCVASIANLKEKQGKAERWKPLFFLSAFLTGPYIYYMIRKCFLYKGFRNSFLKYLGTHSETREKLDQALHLGMGLQLSTRLFLVIAFCIGILSFVTIMVIGRKWDAEKRNALSFLILPLLVFCVLADLMHTDYSGCGVLTIAVIYLLRENKRKAFQWGCIVLTLMSYIECTAFIMLRPISRYNGERGRRINKYFFYAFYPVHILLLYLVGLCLGVVGFSIR